MVALPEKSSFLRANTGDESPGQIRGRLVAGTLPQSLIAEAQAWLASCDQAMQLDALETAKAAAKAAERAAFWTMIAAIATAVGAIATLIVAIATRSS